MNVKPILVEEQSLEIHKEKKVRDLKTAAILSQVQKLASEEQFEYYVKTDSRRLEMYIRLAEYRHIALKLPYNKFEQTLPILRRTILNLLELYKLGVHFQVKQSSISGGWRSETNWIKPEPKDQTNLE